MNDAEAREMMDFLSAIFPQYDVRRVRADRGFGAENYEVQVV